MLVFDGEADDYIIRPSYPFCRFRGEVTVMRWRAAGILLLLLFTGVANAQPLFDDSFPPQEFADRRASVMDAISDGVAILQGATEYPAYVRFRQSNHFFYLTGVEVPRALVVVDGRARRTTLYLPSRNERAERSEGPVLTPGDEAERLTGISTVRSREAFADDLASVLEEGRIVFTPFRPETLAAGTPSHAVAHASASEEDPWDGRRSREKIFIERLGSLVPGVDIRDLDPILDRLRVIKSAREIAVIREATRISGTAILDVMRSAKPGMYEYELAAIGDFYFRRYNANGPAYFALVATGENAHYPHYHASQSMLQPQDLVLYDYAPDYHYYSSDVTRMFPADGRFDGDERERYTVYLRLYQALMAAIRPHVSPQEIIRAAVVEMKEILRSFSFTSAKTEAAARRFVDRYSKSTSNRLGHFVGMEVHDVTAPFDVLQPGMVFTIEPALTIPEDRVYIRLEDVILITQTGYENLSAFVPVDPDEIESLMEEDGLIDLFGGV